MFEVKGKIIRKLPLVEGKSQKGDWKKLEFILETQEQFPKKICLSLWGDKIDEFTLNEGEEATVYFNLESREFKERWYTEARAWKVVKSVSPPNPPVGEEYIPEVEDDLPF